MLLISSYSYANSLRCFAYLGMIDQQINKTTLQIDERESYTVNFSAESSRAIKKVLKFVDSDEVIDTQSMEDFRTYIEGTFARFSESFFQDLEQQRQGRLDELIPDFNACAALYIKDKCPVELQKVIEYIPLFQKLNNNLNSNHMKLLNIYETFYMKTLESYRNQTVLDINVFYQYQKELKEYQEQYYYTKNDYQNMVRTNQNSGNDLYKCITN